jgi:hypothetical protein
MIINFETIIAKFNTTLSLKGIKVTALKGSWSTSSRHTLSTRASSPKVGDGKIVLFVTQPFGL